MVADTLDQPVSNSATASSFSAFRCASTVPNCVVVRCLSFADEVLVRRWGCVVAPPLVAAATGNCRRRSLAAERSTWR